MGKAYGLHCSSGLFVLNVPLLKHFVDSFKWSGGFSRIEVAPFEIFSMLRKKILEDDVSAAFHRNA